MFLKIHNSFTYYSACPRSNYFSFRACTLPLAMALVPQFVTPPSKSLATGLGVLRSYSGATKYGYQRNPRNVGMTLLFAVLTKNEVTAHSFIFFARISSIIINTCTYTISAHGYELSGCVRADAYNLILILHRIIMLPGPGPVYIYCV